MSAEFALTHAWLIPLLPAISFLVVGLFTRMEKKPSAVISITMIAISWLLSCGVVWGVYANNITVEKPFIMQAAWATVGAINFNLGVLIDPLTAMMLFVVTTVALLVQIYSVGYMHDDPGFGRFFAYLSLFAGAMLGMVVSVSFVQLYAFWELVGLCSYLLIGFYYYKISAREAAKKAFITTRIGDFGLLLGILLLQITFGTLDFQELKTLVPEYIWINGTGFMTIVGILLFIGPIGKSGQFPLHVWLPDAMEGPTPVSALIHAATMVVAGVYLVGRAFFIFSSLPLVMSFIAWLGAFTALFAATIAITQRPIKKILAYSTISQLGYMMLALGVGSLTASFFHLMTHAFFKALLFLGAGAVMHAMHDEADIFKMGGLAKKMPTTFMTMTIGVLAIAGLPPFAGFFSKDEILAAAAEVSMPLYIIAAFTAFLTAFYMSRLLFVTFLGELKPDCPAHEVDPFMKTPLLVLAFLAVTSGAWGHFFGFGDWVRFGPAHHEGINLLIASSSTVLSIIAMMLAYGIYVSHRWSSYELREKMGILFTLSYNKFFVDEIYTVFRNIVCDGMGKVCYWIDLNIIDGAVHLSAKCFNWAGAALNYAQNGQVQRYALVFVGGVICLVVYSLIYAYKVYAMIGGAF